MNINTQMVVEFEKYGRTFRGKMRDMPIELMSQWHLPLLSQARTPLYGIVPVRRYTGPGEAICPYLHDPVPRKNQTHKPCFGSPASW